MEPEQLLTLCRLVAAADDASLWADQEDASLENDVKCVLDAVAQDEGYDGWQEALAKLPAKF